MPSRSSWAELPEPALADSALRGEQQAWDEAARRHTRRVVVAMLARGAALEQAEDVAQEAWLRLVERQREGRLGRLELPGLAIAQATWILREQRRVAWRRAAIAAAHPPVEDTAGAASALGPEADVASRERLARVWAALEHCSPRAREIFLAVYGRQDERQAEVARRLGLSLQRVRQTLCEVRARLRAELRDGDDEGDPWNT